MRALLVEIFDPLQDHRIALLQFAEEECGQRDIPRLELSTSELQHAALALYRQAGHL